MYVLGEGRGLTSGCIKTHSQPLLQNHLMDIYEPRKGPARVLRRLSQIQPGADPVRGQHMSLFQKIFLRQTERLQQQTECIAMIKEHVGRSVGSIQKSSFWHILVSYWAQTFPLIFFQIL